MGTDTPDGAGPEQLSSQGRAMSHQEASKADEVGELGISYDDDGDDGSGLERDRGLTSRGGRIWLHNILQRD